MALTSGNERRQQPTSGPLLRRISVSRRLALGCGLLAVMGATVVTISLTGSQSQRAAADRIADAMTIASAAGQVDFRSADLNGWQTAYAFDVLRGAPGAASDTGASRASFLASAEAFRTELTTLLALALTESERTQAQAAKDAFDQFMAADNDVVAGYRAGGAQTEQANQLVIGREIQLFGSMSKALKALVAEAKTQSDKAVSDARSTAAGVRRTLLTLSVVWLAFIVATSVLISRSISRPLRKLQTAMADIARGDGDLTSRLEVTGRDELAAVSAEFNTFVTTIEQSVRAVAESADAVDQEARSLATAAGLIAAAADESSSQSSVVAAATEQVSRNVQTVAAGTEQMGASIREIAMNAGQAARIGAEAFEAAQATSRDIAELDEAGQAIGSVVRLISGIAEQTSMLALNATIEAARAGEAGKGFAVVANEVKQLAEETASATEDIGRKVTAIQHGTTGVTEAIARITTVLDRVSQFQVTIAAAVEEQTNTTTEMSRNVSDAAAGSAEIATGIGSVAGAADTTAGYAADSMQAAERMSRLASQLKERVSVFTF